MTQYAGQYGPEGLEHPDGLHAANTLISVLNVDGSQAQLWLDANRMIPASNPRSTDTLGNLFFYAEPGRYNLSFAGMSIPAIVHKSPYEPGVEITEDDIQAISDGVNEDLGQTDYASLYMSFRS